MYVMKSHEYEARRALQDIYMYVKILIKTFAQISSHNAFINLIAKVYEFLQFCRFLDTKIISISTIFLQREQNRVQ